MTSKATAADLDNAVQDYVAGESAENVAARLHMGYQRFTNELKARGLFRSREDRYRIAVSKGSAKHRAALGLPDAEIARRYLAGESEKGLADAYGVSCGAIKVHLREAGVKRRTQAASARLAGEHVSPERRAELAKVMYEMATTREYTFAERCKRAVTRQERATSVSPAEVQFAEYLSERGFASTPQKAVGSYNVDLALTAAPVAVEVLGGCWHMTKALHAKRTPYILDAGWHLVFVWVDGRRYPLMSAAADYVVAFAQEASLDPSAVREYRVIRGDGDEVARGRADGDDFSDVLARRGHADWRTRSRGPRHKAPT